jgi:hypothetical protein
VRECLLIMKTNSGLLTVGVTGCVKTTIKDDSKLTIVDTEEELDISLLTVYAVKLCEECWVLIRAPQNK